MNAAQQLAGAPIGAPGTAEARVSEGERVRSHFAELMRTVECAARHAPRIERWGLELAERLSGGARILVAGNGGSAAEAQHLTAELVGRYRGERPAFSAISLSSETSSLTAIGNDYGYAEVFARQVRAHGRAGDVLLLLSTSGSSRNLIEAAHEAARGGLTSWAMTGEGPNPLTTVCDESICFDGASPHVQECQLAAVHALCEVFDARIAERQQTDRGRSGS